MSISSVSSNEVDFQNDSAVHNNSTGNDVGQNGDTFQDTGLSPGTNYGYTETDTDGNQSDTSVTTNESAPNLTVVSSSEIDVSWGQLESAWQYVLQRSTDGSNFSDMGNVDRNGGTYNDTSLDANTTYYYRIIARDDSGNDLDSGDVSSATTDGNPNEPAPNLNVVSSSEIDVSTDSLGDAAQYVLQRSTDGSNFGDVTGVDPGGGTYNDTGLSNNTTYYYRIVARDSSGNDVNSGDVSSATTNDDNESAPSLNVASSSEIDVSWDSLGDAPQYVLQRSTDGSNFGDVTGVNSGGGAYYDTGLGTNTTYYYRIVARDESGNDVEGGDANSATTYHSGPSGPTTIATTGPTIIEAEDYDNGGEGAAYHDTTSWNQGGAYRNEGVDIGVVNGTTYVGWTGAGEWMNYSINVQQSGNYNFTFRVASGMSGGQFHLNVDGQNVTGTIGTPFTGGWGSFQNVTVYNVALSAGPHVLRLVMDGGAYYCGNFDQITITPAAPTQAPGPFHGFPLPISATAPTVLQFEDYDKGGEGVAYHDSDPWNQGGAYRNDGVDIGADNGTTYVGWTQVGEWMNYTINVAQTGNYSFMFRQASIGSGSLRLDLDGTNILLNYGLPNTGSYGIFQKVIVNNVPLTAGQHVLRVTVGGPANLDSMLITPMSVAAPLLRDGSFEDVIVDESGGTHAMLPGATFGGIDGTAWHTISSPYGGNSNAPGPQSVKLVTSRQGSHVAAVYGGQSIDLSGYDAGGIYQDVATTSGQTYTLRYAVAANPSTESGVPPIKTLHVLVGGQLVDVMSADSTGQSAANPGWHYYELSFGATSSTTRIEFLSATPGDAGPMLDDVSLRAGAAATPAAPTGLTAALNGNTGGVNVAWTEASGDSGGTLVERSLDGENWTALAIVSQGQSTYHDPNPGPLGGQASYRVRGVSNAGRGAASAIASVNLVPPASPSNLLAVPVSGLVAQLFWSNHATNQSTVHVQMSVDGGAHWTDAVVVSGQANSAVVSGLTPATAYLFRAYAFNGLASGYTNVVAMTTPQQQLGLNAAYYANNHFSGSPTTRVDGNIDFSSSAGWTGAPDPSTAYSVRWTGQLVPQVTSQYKFYTQSDGGIRVWVNGQLVIDDWTSHGVTQDAALSYLPLQAGTSYAIRVDYRHDAGPLAVARLQWQDVQGSTISAVPGVDLLPVATGTAAPSISGPSTVNEGSPYTLTLNGPTDPNRGAVVSWTIHWDANSLQNVSGNPSTVTHTYPDGPAVVSLTATAFYADGTSVDVKLGADQGFGSSGMIVTDYTSEPELANGLVMTTVNSQRKILVIGRRDPSGHFGITRFNADTGALDTTFGTNGHADTGLGSADERVIRVVVQPDGKILAAGFASSDVQVNKKLLIARFLSNGAIDTSFGNNGVVQTDLFVHDSGNGLALQASNGGIVVAAASAEQTDVNVGNIKIERYTASGARDTSFGTGGYIQTPMEAYFWFGATVQGDGKILADGWDWTSTGWQSHLRRYNANGSVDTAFGTNGQIATNFQSVDDFADAVVVQPDGHIVIGGGKQVNHSSYYYGLSRYNSDGTPDTTFAATGTLVTPLHSGGHWPSNIAVQGDGKIVTAGLSASGSGKYDLLRYNVDGTPDATFGVNGTLATTFAGGNSSGNALLVDMDGTIYLAGRDAVSGHFALARFGTSNGLTVTNAAASIDPIADRQVEVERTVQFTATFTDPGTSDTHTATINWGDGTSATSASVSETGGAGSVTGSHVYHATGSYTVTVTLVDKDGGVATRQFSVEVVEAGVAPVAVDDPAPGGTQVLTVLHDRPANINVRANDYDPQGGYIDVDPTSLPAHTARGGTVAVNADGTIRYQPPPAFVGTDTFTYALIASDGLTSNTATVTVQVINTPPQARSIVINPKPGPNQITQHLQGSDADGDALIFEIHDQPQHGTVDLDPTTGNFIYVPNDDPVLPDSFTYTVTDGVTRSTLATVQVNPAAPTITYFGQIDGSAYLYIKGNKVWARLRAYLELNSHTIDGVPGGDDAVWTLPGDGLGDSTAVTLAWSRVSSLDNTTLLPADNYQQIHVMQEPSASNGYETIIQINDDVHPDTDRFVMTITGSHADVPEAANLNLSIPQGQSLSIATGDVDSLLNQGNGGHTPYTVQLVSVGDNPLLASSPNRFQVNSNGSFSYNPPAGFAGTDWFTYRLVDADGVVSNDANVFVNVVAAAATTSTPQVQLKVDALSHSSPGGGSVVPIDLLFHDAESPYTLNFAGVDPYLIPVHLLVSPNPLPTGSTVTLSLKGDAKDYPQNFYGESGSIKVFQRTDPATWANTAVPEYHCLIEDFDGQTTWTIDPTTSDGTLPDTFYIQGYSSSGEPRGLNMSLSVTLPGQDVPSAVATTRITTVDVEPMPDTSLPTPVNLQAAPLDTSSVRLTWDMTRRRRTGASSASTPMTTTVQNWTRVRSRTSATPGRSSTPGWSLAGITTTASPTSCPSRLPRCRRLSASRRIPSRKHLRG